MNRLSTIRTMIMSFCMIFLWSPYETYSMHDEEQKELFGEGPTAQKDLTQFLQAFLPNSLADIIEDQTKITWLTPGLKIGEEILTKIVYVNSVRQKSISPDGTFMVAGLHKAWDDQRLLILNMDGVVLNKPEHLSPFSQAEISQNSQFIVTDNSITKKFNSTLRTEIVRNDGTLLHTLEGVRPSQIAPDNSFILGRSHDDRTLQIWSTDGILLHTLNESAGSGGTTSSISPDSTYIAATVGSHGAENVQIWGTNGELRHIFNHMQHPRIAPNSDFIVTQSTFNAGRSSTLYILGKDGKRLHTIENIAPSNISISPDSQYIVVMSSSNTAAVIDMDGVVHRLEEPQLLSYGTISPDSKHIVTIMGDYQKPHVVQIRDREGRLLHTCDTNSIGTPLQAIISPDSSFMIIQFVGGPVMQLWSMDGTLLQTLRANSTIDGIEISPDGQTIVTKQSVRAPGVIEYNIQLWKLNNVRPNRKPKKTPEEKKAVTTLNKDLLNAITRLVALEQDAIRLNNDSKIATAKLDKPIQTMAQQLSKGLPAVQTMLNHVRGLLKDKEDTQIAQKKQLHNDIRTAIEKVTDPELKRTLRSYTATLSSNASNASTTRELAQSLLPGHSEEDKDEIRVIVDALDRLGRIQEERVNKDIVTQRLESLVALLSQLQNTHHKIERKSAQIRELINEGADPRAMMPDIEGRTKSITEIAIDSLGVEHSIIKSLQAVQDMSEEELKVAGR